MTTLATNPSYLRIARYVYAFLAWAFVAGILLQIFYVGIGLFVEPQDFELHRTFGWILHPFPVLILLAAPVARAGGRRILLTTALAVAVFFIPILAAVRADLPWVAVFHPVSAVLGFLLAVVVARGATKLVQTSDPAPSTTVAEWILVALVIAAILFLSFSGSPEP
jgi:hypothetical protein